MTAISPYVGAAPLAMPAPAQSTMSLQEALAAGSSLGGTASPQDPGIRIDAPTVAYAAPQLAGVSGGGAQAVQGAAAVDEQQLVAILEQAISAVQQLIAARQAQGGAAVGGGAASIGQCGMSGCTMDHSQVVMQGPSGAPQVAGSLPVEPRPEPRQQEPPAPPRVPDRASTRGLRAVSLRGLQEAHRFGLPLVSGHRPGSARSDHASGHAIDVSDLPIGDPKSVAGTGSMRAYAEHMRQAGKDGRLGVKYVILDGRIASATNDWAWRPYTYPGKSRAQLDALKASNRGEYNRLQHFDHVHVSFR